jgi:hypothetical protein
MYTIKSNTSNADWALKNMLWELNAETDSMRQFRELAKLRDESIKREEAKQKVELASIYYECCSQLQKAKLEYASQKIMNLVKKMAEDEAKFNNEFPYLTK